MLTWDREHLNTAYFSVEVNEAEEMVPAVPLGQTLDFGVVSLILIWYKRGYIVGVK
jgi:hypothetical protein